MSLGGTDPVDRERAGRRRHLVTRASRVALVAALITTAAYLALVAVIDLLVANRLYSQVDSQIGTSLAAARSASGAGPRSSVISDGDSRHSGLGIFGAPVFLWQLSPQGRVVAASPGSPRLAEGDWTAAAGMHTETMIGQPFHAEVVEDRWGWLVAGESVAEVGHLGSVLWVFEGLALPVVFAVVFVAAFGVARRAAAPVERARRRELEFTADASHELRTPLSVLRAEVALARRSPAADQADAGVLDRIDREAVRLSQIVEDLLFLARSEAEPPPPSDELVDLGTLVAASAERFATIAASRRVGLVSHPPPGGAQIHAPAEWIDRLLGILLDNACRYAADGGTVAVRATVAGRRAGILVEDDGPGIPENERARLFDRFHRADDRPGGHGLGLAIADSIVRSTRGQWQIGDSSYGGAQMEVSWPLRQRVRRHR